MEEQKKLKPKMPFNQDDKNPRKGPKFNVFWVYGIILVTVLAINLFNNTSTIDDKTINFVEFKNTYLNTGNVAKLVVVNKEYVEVYAKTSAVITPTDKKTAFSEGNPDAKITISSADQFIKDLNEAQSKIPDNQQVGVKFENRESILKDILNSPFLFLGVLVLLTLFMMRSAGGMGGMGGGSGGIFSIGKSKAQLFEKGTKVNITFNDVAGLDEAKEEVMEIVDFLKNPKKYTNLGGKIPKGALLVGPPGTGKTLLAKAVAGEAQVPFFSMSGSDFVEMFVGVGASRVRDLFKQAREKSPCIVFIDEIDAIGRARGKNAVMSNDERENTLNQMLVEMDGFSGDSGIIVLAATNRPDVLDTALLRPGRFDRQISIDVPDVKGREKIFDVHLQPIKKSNNLNIKKLAEQTPGFAGADIANICNEAALIAARKGKEEVDMSDFNDAIDRVIGGLEKKNKIISPEEKKTIAYHESGHAVAGWYLEHAYPLVKVTIVPRGDAALGYAQYLPKEKYITVKEELEDRICMSLGGRAVEEIIFGKISTGALSDLQQVTRMAYAMVSVYGMNSKVGNISFYDPSNENSFQKPYSEQTGKLIDDEVRIIIEEAYVRTKKLLTEKIDSVKVIAEELLKKEVLYKDDLTRLLGARAYADDTDTEDFEPSYTETISKPGTVQPII